MHVWFLFFFFFFLSFKGLEEDLFAWAASPFAFPGLRRAGFATLLSWSSNRGLERGCQGGAPPKLGCPGEVPRSSSMKISPSYEIGLRKVKNLAAAGAALRSAAVTAGGCCVP